MQGESSSGTPPEVKQRVCTPPFLICHRAPARSPVSVANNIHPPWQYFGPARSTWATNKPAKPASHQPATSAGVRGWEGPGMIDVGCPGCTPTSQYSWKIHSGPFSLEACICETLSARWRCDRSGLVIARGGGVCACLILGLIFNNAGLPRADPFSAAGGLHRQALPRLAGVIPACPRHTLLRSSNVTIRPCRLCLSSQLRYGPQTRPAL